MLNKEIAIRKDEGRKVSALVPIDLDGHVFDWDHDLKDDVLSRNVGDFKSWEQTKEIPEGPLDLLIRALKLDDAGRGQVPPKRL